MRREQHKDYIKTVRRMEAKKQRNRERLATCILAIAAFAPMVIAYFQ